MRIRAFSARPDEDEFFGRFSREYGHDLVKDPRPLNIQTAADTRGFEGLSIVQDGYLTDDVMQVLIDNGVKYLALRTIGYDGINVKMANDHGVRLSHAGYSAYSVANYTVMMILMCLRKALYILMRSHTADYSLGKAEGREMQNMTVGVIGTGRIGKAVIKNLSGFGCKIIAYDICPSKDLDNVEYVSLDELYRCSDIITLHTFLSEDTFHMIDEKAIARMKDGVTIINCARGALIDTKALIKAIEDGKVGSAGIDCFEGEDDVIRTDHNYDRRVTNHDYIILKSFQNTIVSPHVAFYTDQAVSDMVECSLRSLSQFEKGEAVPLEIHA